MPHPGTYTGGGQSGHKPGLPTSTGKRRHTLRPSGSPLSPSEEARRPRHMGYAVRAKNPGGVPDLVEAETENFLVTWR
jgi:hypothetical protein